MGREVRRVPLDFNWPLDKVWEGFLTPDKYNEDPCPDCENGWSHRAQHLLDQWYGKAPFDPAETGSTRLYGSTPAVTAFAERNVAHAPEYYGTSPYAVSREANRLAALWNGMWAHHLSQDDVDALVEAEGLREFTHTWDRTERRWDKIEPPVKPTAEQINEWSLQPGLGGHDCIDAYRVIRARCEREGVDDTCPTCKGHATLEKYPGQRAEGEAWEPTEPPTGEGWQLWETVSEGSPVSPVFKTADELAQWMTLPERGWRRLAPDAARKFVEAGWAPTGAVVGGMAIEGTAYIGGMAEPVTIPDDARDA